MNSANRRGFLKIAGAGAAAAGAASLNPMTTSIASAGSPAPAVSHTLPAGASGSMVAYVHDISRGEIAVMIEGREVTVTDHALIARLATAVHSAANTAV